MASHIHFRYLSLALLGGMLFCSGCGGPSDKAYTPASATSRDVLNAALERWKSGQQPGEVRPTASGVPAIQAGDFEWAEGKKLVNFQIGEEGPPVETGPRVWKVQLELEGEAPRQVTYHVVGHDPIWVLRDEDFSKAGM